LLLRFVFTAAVLYYVFLVDLAYWLMWMASEAYYEYNEYEYEYEYECDE